MNYKMFTDEQVQQFIEKGWVKLEQAIPREKALAAQDVVWRELLTPQHGLVKDDRSTWTKKKVHLYRVRELFETPEFMACNTPELFDAVEDLVGVGRLEEGRIPNYHFGTIPVNFFDGADRPWTVPKKGWHYDGSFFHHYVNSREQGLLVLVLFSDIAKHGGGTLAVEGSHHVVANVLNQHPEGLSFAEANKASFASDPWLQELCGTSADDYSKSSGPKAYSYSSVWDDDAETDPEGARVEKFMNQTYETTEGYKLRVIETMGQAGDCYFLHPFMIHAASQNHSGNPRFIGNRKNTLSEPLQLERENPEEYSPVELAIRQALYGTAKA